MVKDKHYDPVSFFEMLGVIEVCAQIERMLVCYHLKCAISMKIAQCDLQLTHKVHGSLEGKSVHW